MRILITGGAGFIGSNLITRLLFLENVICCVDNMNSYYDKVLKYDRLKNFKSNSLLTIEQVDIINNIIVEEIFKTFKPNVVIHLAAQAGVRYSIDNPKAYVDSNLIGFMNIIEACRKYPVKHLIYASSSSVYGGNKCAPFSTNHNVDHPVSLYAATKKANELIAHAYSHLYGIPTTGLRFFTVYGPWGRPDMAYFSFTKDIIEGNPIKVYNHGQMERDFTYIDDILDAIIKLIDMPPVGNKDWDESKDSISESFAPYKIYNIGNNNPVSLLRFIEAIEKAVGKEAKKIYMDMQPGDVLRTYADVSDLENDIGFKPKTSIEDGIQKFVDWYKEYYQIKD